jgi:hypothetical protein
MPIACILMMFAPLFVAVPMAHNESVKEQKVNQMCIEKFKNPSEIQQCKTILMNINSKDITNDR